MIKQAVLESGYSSQLLSRSATSEVSTGDRHGKCEDVKCVRKTV
jgi:hypothetical protein